MWVLFLILWWCLVGCCVRGFLFPRFCFWCRVCWFEVSRCFCPLVDCCLWVGGWCFVGYVLLCWLCLVLFYDLCGYVNGASPVRFVLSLFYLCAFQMNPVCVVCVVTSDWGVLLVYCLWQRSEIHMTGVCLFGCVVGPRFDSTSPDFVRRRASQPGGRERRMDGIGPHLWGKGLCRHNLCRCLYHSNLVQAVSFWNWGNLFS